jgi:hypothetical protein
MTTDGTAVAAVINAAASGSASTDWAGIAAVITAFAAGVASVITIIWNGNALRKQQAAQAAEQRKQQLADMIATAFSHFKGGTQNRSAGIAALQIVRAGSEDLDKDQAWKTYGPAVQGLLYSQLMYLYNKGAHKASPHEAANVELMSNWIFGNDFQLDSHMKAKLEKARREYESKQQESRPPVV